MGINSVGRGFFRFGLDFGALEEEIMSTLPYLSDDEIKGIVKPLSQPAAIVRWFRSHGFPKCQVRPNGLPLITRAEFDAEHSKNATVQESPSIDVEAMLKRFSKSGKTKASA